MNNRYYSLDVFRGATVALMILVNNPGSWSHIYSPLEHASWHGCTPTDMVFPFFLFAVGNALAFVMPRFKEAGTPFFLKKVLKRSFLIFAIGLFLNWSPFIKWDNNLLTGKPWQDVRIMGVLQRIALCYLFASLIVYFGRPLKSIIVGILLLLSYWFICILLGEPGSPYSLSGYFGTELDINILGINHIYKGEGVPFDPEGLFSTIPAIVQVLIGCLIGQYILKKGKTSNLVMHLLLVAVLLVVVGLVWSSTFPLNKKIWSSSYVLYTAGLAVFMLTFLIYFIEFKGYRGAITRFFDVFGKNPLFIFVLSGFLPRLLGLIRIPSSNGTTTPLGWFYAHVCKPVSDNPNNGSLLYAIILLLFYWLIAKLLDKKKIYIKV